jgi:chromate transporter
MTDLAVLAWTFFRLSFLCIGGGLSSLPEMQRQAVSVHGWITAREFVDGYALSQMTPGPAMLVVAFIGYRVGAIPGALTATAALFLPPALLTVVVGHFWGRFRTRPWAIALERTLAPIALGLMAAGVYTVGRSATDLFHAALALAAALVLARGWLPPAAVALLAGIVSRLLLA